MRRFNVAASRAEDQMWLFHSVTLNDLNPGCLRYAFLDYCRNPRVEPLNPVGLSLEELGGLARVARRSEGVPPSPFESWFEVDVYLKIVGRGYRVIPQYEVARRRIDLVVEGMRGRLAVECNGDSWHGPEKYEKDMARQRMLERGGMTFWTVWGSTFYREPDAAMEGLWTILGRLRIYPTGQEPRQEQGPRNAHRDATASSEVAQHASQQHSEELPRHLGFRSPRPRARNARGSEDDLDGKGEEKSQPPETLEGGQPSPERPDEEATERTRGPVSSDFLEPYRKWASRRLPDPRSSPIDELVPVLVEIVGAEGPMPCHRAYRLYASAAGIQRVGRQIRSLFNRAVRRAVRLGLLEESNEHGHRDQMNQIVRRKGTPEVVVRNRGDRTFYEIPPGEVRAVIDHLRSTEPHLKGEAVVRRLLELYEVKRLTTPTREAILALMGRSQT
jgi:very-short-patch-repair endonuclease